MQFLARFSMYFRWSLEVPFIPEMRVITILVCGNLLLALAFAKNVILARWKRSNWLVFSNLFLFFLAVGIGAAFTV